MEAITLTIPKTVAQALSTMTALLRERMHALLERNADGRLSPIECDELQFLVATAQSTELFAAAIERSQSNV